MKISKKENKIRDLFQNEATPFDVDAFWNELEPKLEKKKKRRFIFWFLLGGLLLGYGLYQANLHQSSSKVVANHFSEKSLEKKEDCINSDETPSVLNPNIMDKKVIQKTDFIKSAHQKLIVSSNNPISLNKKSKIVQSDSKQIVTSKSALINHILEKPTKVINNEMVDAKLMVNVNPIIPIEKSEKTKFDKSEDNVQTKTPSKEERLKIQKAKKKQRIAEKAKRKLALKKRRRQRQWKRNIKKIKNIFDPWSTDLDVAYGLEYGVKVMKTDFPKIEQFIDQRKKEERMLETQSLSIHFNHKHKNGFVFEYGIDFRQMTQLYEFSSFEEHKYTKSGVVGVVEDNYGNTIREYYGMKFYYEKIEVKKHIYKKQQMINIPFTLGYFKQHRKFYYEILGGLDFNFYSKNERQTTFGEAYLEIPPKTPRKYFYRTTGIGLTGSFKISRKITKRLSIYGAPYFKFNLRPLNTKYYALFEKYHFVGMHLGFKVNLFQ